MSREEFNELIYYISQLKHQYNRKIDEQTEKINEQNTVIEELLWQLRELTDKVRRLSDNVKSLETKVEESERNRDKSDKSDGRSYENSILRANAGQMRGDFSGDNSDNDKANDDDIYETIEFSDSSTHIYTEPVKDTLQKDNNNTKKVTAKITTTESAVLRTKSSGGRKKVAERPKELSGFKSYLNEEEYETESDSAEESNVTLRRTGCKSAPTKNKKSPSKVLVSAIETGFIPGMSELTDENFIHIPSTQQLTVSGLSINFSTPPRSRHQRNDFMERNVTF